MKESRADKDVPHDLHRQCRLPAFPHKTHNLFLVRCDAGLAGPSWPTFRTYLLIPPDCYCLAALLAGQIRACQQDLYERDFKFPATECLCQAPVGASPLPCSSQQQHMKRGAAMEKNAHAYRFAFKTWQPSDMCFLSIVVVIAVAAFPSSSLSLL